MSKEPNGVLVMATCKCRENIKNLVMTRTFFEEQLQRKFDEGVKAENKRIVDKLGDNIGYLVSCSAFDVIALIKEGKEND